MPVAWIDRALVDKSALRVAVGDFGFSRGLTIFELLRVYDGVPFHLNDHLLRMQGGVTTLGQSLPITLPEVEAATRKLIETNHFPHSTVRYYFTAGESRTSPYGFAGDYGFTPHLMIIEDEVKPQHPEAPYGLDFYQRGQRLKIMPYERAMPSVKSATYMQAFVASREAGPEWDDILFTHRDGYVTEATRANFFCVIDGVLCTPNKDMLFGITRKVILEIAHQLRIPTAERELTPADLARASEAFTTGSYAEMLPAKQIDDHILPTTMEGPVFSALRRGFSARIKKRKPLS